MKRILLYLLLMASLAVYAQEQADDAEPVAPETEQPANPDPEGEDSSGDIPAEDDLDADTDLEPEAGLEPETEPEVEVGLEPETEPEVEAGPEAEAGLELETEPEIGTTEIISEDGTEHEAGAEGETGPEDSEFIPEEEISEDYPVPLPSDI